MPFIIPFLKLDLKLCNVTTKKPMNRQVLDFFQINSNVEIFFRRQMSWRMERDPIGRRRADDQYWISSFFFSYPSFLLFLSLLFSKRNQRTTPAAAKFRPPLLPSLGKWNGCREGDWGGGHLRLIDESPECDLPHSLLHSQNKRKHQWQSSIKLGGLVGPNPSLWASVDWHKLERANWSIFQASLPHVLAMVPLPWSRAGHDFGFSFH